MGAAVAPLTSAEMTDFARRPMSRLTEKRYEEPEKRIREALQAKGIDPDSLASYDCLQERPVAERLVNILIAVIFGRIGPKSLGYEERQAHGTGAPIKAAFVAMWRREVCTSDVPYEDLGGGKFRGNPGQAPEVQALIQKIKLAQDEADCNLVKRAPCETHEDLREVYEECIEGFVEQIVVYRRPLSQDELEILMSALLNSMQFGAVSRAAELICLQQEGLSFYGSALDSPVSGRTEHTKCRRTKETYYTFRNGVRVCISSLTSLQSLLLVLDFYGMTGGNLFPTVAGGRLIAGSRMTHGQYTSGLKKISEKCGFAQPLQGHSARRGGVGYYYYVLRWDLPTIWREFSWDSVAEMMNYLGLNDEHNAYHLAGFTTQSAMRNQMPALGL